MKTILFSAMALTLATAAHASCLGDIKANVLAAQKSTVAGSFFEIGATNEIYADGGVQTTRLYVNEIGKDGEGTGNGSVSDLSIQPTDKDLTQHIVSQSCTVIGARKAN